MRRLMWFAIGFGISCTLGAYFWIGVWMIPAVILGAAGLLCFLRKEKWMKRTAWTCLGILLGTGWFFAFDWMYTAPLRALDGKTPDLYLTTADYSWQTDYGSAVDCDLDLEGKRYRIRLYLTDPQELAPGTMVHIAAELRLTTDGGAKQPTFHRTQGILALAYQREQAEYTLPEGWEISFWTAFRTEVGIAILDTIDQCFAGENAAFAKALLLGDTRDISYEMNTDFTVSGIRHIVAVSGLHMSILFGVVAFLTRKQRWLLTVFGIPSILLFMLLAGFTPSVTRAGIMMILMILSLVFKREYDPPTALSFAVVGMLMANPLVAASVGFQLSVASVAGIFLFMGKISGWILQWIPKQENKCLKFLRNWFAVSVGVTLSAQSLTTPLAAYYFHTVSLVSVLTNLAVLWVITFVFWGIMLVCLVGFFRVDIGVFLGKILSIPIWYIRMSAKALAKLPLAAVYTESIYIVIWLCFVYCLIGLLVFGREKRPFLSMGLAMGALAVALSLSWLEPRIHDQSVTVLDVGQGQSVILQHRDKTILVDCGGDYDDGAADTAAQTLLSMGITRIDGLIVTHYDRDHWGGVPGLLYRVSAEKLWLPPGEESEAIVSAAKGGEVIWVEERTQIHFDGLNLTLFPSKYADSDNERSVAVLFQTEKCDTLLTGDMNTLYEQILIREQEIPDLEILIAGHHGSNNSTSQTLLDAAAPDAVVISVGKDNRYGHPAPETLDRLIRRGCAIYRTDESGTIVLRR